jgi:enoyl-[acyl-carrier protein] reductase II
VRLLELERAGASPEELSHFLGYRRAHQSQLEGDLDEGEIFAGASVGLIKEIIPAAKVVQNLVEGYENVIAQLVNTLGSMSM